MLKNNRRNVIFIKRDNEAVEERTFLMKVDVAVPRQDVEYCVEKTIDEQNKTDKERS